VRSSVNVNAFRAAKSVIDWTSVSYLMLDSQEPSESNEYTAPVAESVVLTVIELDDRLENDKDWIESA